MLFLAYWYLTIDEVTVSPVAHFPSLLVITRSERINESPTNDVS